MLKYTEDDNYDMDSSKEDLMFYEIMDDTIYERSDDIYWWFNFENHIMHFWGRTVALYNAEYIMPNFPKCIYNKNIILQDDIYVFNLMKDSILAGKEDKFEFRLKKINGEISLFECKYKIIFNNLQRDVFGKLKSISINRNIVGSGLNWML